MVMKKLLLVVVLSMTAAINAIAGEIKILKTEATNITFDMNSNLYVHINVEMQLANIKKEEYSVVIIMDNNRWPANLSYEDFSYLINNRCYNEEPLPVVGARGRRTVEVVVPLEKQKLSSKNDTLFYEAYVFKIEPLEYITHGVFMYILPNYQVLREKMLDSTMGIAGDIIGDFLFESIFPKTIPDNADVCDRCIGSGKCPLCNGTGIWRSKKCATCEGNGRCPTCSGKGYYYNLFK